MNDIDKRAGSLFRFDTRLSHAPASRLIFTAIMACILSSGCQTTRQPIQAKAAIPSKTAGVPPAVAAHIHREQPGSDDTDSYVADSPVRAVFFQPSSSEESTQSVVPAEKMFDAAVVTVLDDPSSVSRKQSVNIDESSKVVIPDDVESASSYPIDLTTTLRLAGASHLQVSLARERIQEACAKLEQANVLWIPSLSFGAGFNRHDGPIQDTQGNVIDVSRKSLYLGGGPTIGSSPLSGGASGRARLFVDLSTADIYFEPLAARQNVRANQFSQQVALNDSVLQAGIAYQELVRAQLQIAVADEAIANTDELVGLTQDFADAGKGLVADAQRAVAELHQRRRERSIAAERTAVASTWDMRVPGSAVDATMIFRTSESSATCPSKLVCRIHSSELTAWNFRASSLFPAAVCT